MKVFFDGLINSKLSLVRVNVGRNYGNLWLELYVIPSRANWRCERMPPRKLPGGDARLK